MSRHGRWTPPPGRAGHPPVPELRPRPRKRVRTSRRLEDAVLEELAGGPRPRSAVKREIAAAYRCSRRAIELAGRELEARGELEVLDGDETLWALPGGGGR